MARGLTAFVAGMGEGYLDGKDKARKQKMEDERHGLLMQRERLEMERLQTEKLAREEIKNLYQDTKPVQAYVVENPNGRMIYTDEGLANQHAAADPTSRVTQAFAVNGQVVQDKVQAEQMAERINSPAGRLKREMAIYKKYGMMDRAKGAAELYEAEVKANHQGVVNQMLEFSRANDIDGAMKFYSQNVHDGLQTKAQVNPDGTVSMLWMRNGQPVGKPEVYKDSADFWAKTLESVSKSPANLWESVRFDKEFGLKERQVKTQEQEGAARVSNLNANTADVAAAAQDRRTNANANAAQVGVAGYNATTQRLGLQKPTFSSFPTADGGVGVVSTQPRLNPDGTWSTDVGKPVVAPGLKHPAAMKTDPFGGLGGLVAPPTGVQVNPEAVGNVMRMMQEEAARREAARRTPGPGGISQEEFVRRNGG
jgi:hypothetical protein